jgi:cytochrome c oxidase cbb3-type subunit 3
MRTLFSLFAAALVCLALSACRGSRAPQHDVLMEAIGNFSGVFDTRLDHGRQVYSRYCSVCHGLEGKGDGFNAYTLDPRPRDFTDSAFISQVDSALMVEVITKGGRVANLSPLMPAWGHTLTGDDITDVSAYVLHLARAVQAQEK